MLMIDNATVERVLTMRDCIDVQERAFAGLLTGASIGRPRFDTYVPRRNAPHDERSYYRFGSVDGATDGILAVRLKSDVMVWPEGGNEQKFSVEPGTYCGLVVTIGFQWPAICVHCAIVSL